MHRAAPSGWRQEIRVLGGGGGAGEGPGGWPSFVVMQQPLFSAALSRHSNLSADFDGDIFFLEDCSKRFSLLHIYDFFLFL